MKKSAVLSKFAPPKEKVKMEVSLEEALDLAEFGKYQVLHCTLMLATLSSAIVEMIGGAFILPAAACDLELPDTLKGILISMPNIGVILTAPFWGRAADSLGRKPVLLASAAASGTLGFIAAFMPNLLSFALCKLAGSLFLACPSSLGWAYASELVPQRRRDLSLLIMNGFLTTSATLSPLLAWGILPLDWAGLRPWRLLAMVSALPLVVVALWLTQAQESPKFLMTKGKQEKALAVLSHIYSRNTGAPHDMYPVTAIKRTGLKTDSSSEDGSNYELAPSRTPTTVWTLLRPPHIKWLALTGFLMFGLFSLLNGLFLFAPDTINKVMQGSEEDEGTICDLMNQSGQTNETSSSTCVDSISRDTFIIMAVTTAAYGLAVMAISMLPLSKKNLLIGMYLCVGITCLLAGLLKNRIVAGVLMSALQVTALGIGPLTAYAVQLFPTSLRAIKQLVQRIVKLLQETPYIGIKEEVLIYHQRTAETTGTRNFKFGPELTFMTYARDKTGCLEIPSLRGTAVGAVLMCGRLGSVIGANAAGTLLAVACAATFHGFTALLFLCAVLTLLLPNDRKPSSAAHSEDGS